MLLFYVSKFLPFFILPFGLSLVLILSQFFVSFDLPLIFACLILLFFSNYFIAQKLSKYIEKPFEKVETFTVKNADAIVVLSGGIYIAPGKSKTIEFTQPNRFLAGIELFLEKKSCNLIFTGGFNPFTPDVPLEGDIYTKRAIALGIPSKAIATTSPVSNTADESLAIKNLLVAKKKIKVPEIILVTSAYHMKRAMYLFQKQGIKVIPFPVDFKSKVKSNDSRNSFIWLPSLDNLTLSSNVIHEIIGRIIYRIN